MMKYIILFLFATLAHAADLQIRQITSEQTGAGYLVKYIENGVVYCWGMPDVLDPAFIPLVWTPVTQAAIDYRWPVMTGDAALACSSGPAISRTKGGPMYTINTRMRVETVGTVPAGVPCGDKIMWANFFYAVYYDGTYGFAACS